MQNDMQLSQGGVACAAPPVSGLKFRVLIVDDNDDIRKLLAMFLRNVPFGVDFACDGREALEMYHIAQQKGIPYNLLVLDNQMPELTGMDVAERVRATGDSKTMIAFFTAYLESLDEQRVANVKAIGVWFKTDGLLNVGELIEKVLQKKD